MIMARVKRDEPFFAEVNLRHKFFAKERLRMSVTAVHLVVDSGGFIKNDLGTLDAMTDNIVTLHEVNTGL